MKKLRLKTVIVISSLVIGVSIVSLEIGIRATGVMDFPIYQTDDEIGYILAPSQSGVFLNKNEWTLNEKSMNAEQWEPNGRKDILLVGDSVVWGGNAQAQSDRLGTRLEQEIPDWSVWPITAGSWSIGNFLVYFERNPDVLSEGDVIVFVLNTGDLSPASQWKLETTHPRSRPISALLYSVEKYLKPRIVGLIPQAETQKSPEGRRGDSSLEFDDVTISEFETFLSKEAKNRNVRFLFIAYPGKGVVLGDSTEESKYESFLEKLSESVGAFGVIFDLSTSPAWSENLYRDGIHPNVNGNRVLAQEIARALHENDMLRPSTAD